MDARGGAHVPTLVGIGALLAAVVVSMAMLLFARPGTSGAADRPTVSGAHIRAGLLPPQFSGTAVDGSHVDLESLRGKVVVVNFFATTCVNCRAELPLLERTSQRLAGQGLAVIAVNFEDVGDARAMLRDAGVTFPALLDRDSDIGQAYDVVDLPESVFLRRDGAVADVFHGQLSELTLGREITPLLAEAAPTSASSG